MSALCARGSSNERRPDIAPRRDERILARALADRGGGGCGCAAGSLSAGAGLDDGARPRSGTAAADIDPAFAGPSGAVPAATAQAGRGHDAAGAGAATGAGAAEEAGQRSPRFRRSVAGTQAEARAAAAEDAAG